MAKRKFIGNGRIKDERGLVWFIDGFHYEDTDLDPMNVDQKDYSSIRTRSYLRVFRFEYPIDYLATGPRRRAQSLIIDLLGFQQIEYFGKDHPLAGQIKSIIF